MSKKCWVVKDQFHALFWVDGKGWKETEATPFQDRSTIVPGSGIWWPAEYEDLGFGDSFAVVKPAPVNP